jgi:hypothetical protein
MVVAVAVAAEAAEAAEVTAAVVAVAVVEAAKATAAVVAVSVVEAAEVVVEAALTGMVFSITLCFPSEPSSEESFNINSGIGFWSSSALLRRLTS